MYNRRFFDAVRHRLINTTQPSQPPASSDPAAEKLTVLIDYQNLFFVFRKAYEVYAAGIHIPNLLQEFAQAHGFEIGEVYLFSGVPNPQYDREGAERTEKRMAWLRHLGVKVRTAELHYFVDRVTGKHVPREKGIDVMLASELMRLVQAGRRQVLIVSHDRDIAQAVRIAEEVCVGQGEELRAYSIVPTGIDRTEVSKREIGIDGIDFTLRLELPKTMVERHQIKQLPKSQALFETISSD